MPLPSIIKYMGSKRELLDFVNNAIIDIHEGELICDLFAGTAIVGASLSHLAPIWSNDIQSYSQVFARTYMVDPQNIGDIVLDDIVDQAELYYNEFRDQSPGLNFVYTDEMSLEEFQEIETAQQNLQNFDFERQDYHLFTKYYSGTYWSYEQCVWIDSFRKVAEDYRNTNKYHLILSCLMYAMAYNAQSTGHYAQYRDANDEHSMRDIKIYRLKSIKEYFVKKFDQLVQYILTKDIEHEKFYTTLDYIECIEQLPLNSLIYADPPYAFVHYSRFYHALETIVRYDYPELKFKGRYRQDRHQSPFCQKSNVEMAFSNMFRSVINGNHKMVLSYSNTGMIKLERIAELLRQETLNYTIEKQDIDYRHSTMGRSGDKNRDVRESLIIIQPG